LFRASRIDFCCGGDIVLGEAARARGLDVAALEASLHALHADAAATPPEPTDALVKHIVARYHETHRRELVELVRLAHKVEAVHRDHPDVPRGLADELEGLRLELHEHMHKEEEILFPMLLAGGAAQSGFPIEQMRREHRHHGERLARLEELAHEFEVPVDACRSWCALYAGSSKFVEDVREHIHLENNVLFPRFGGS
jgi:regulator of cell morphogenesis and NO signaling